MAIIVRQFLCLEDNYGFLVHSDKSGETWCIDTPDADKILAELELSGWKLTSILNTHHHDDHVGGNLAIKAATGCEVIGPRGHASRIPGADRLVGEGDVIGAGEDVIKVLDIPGHTRGHVAFWFEQQSAIFVGDTLFPLGCGRLFGGTIDELHDSLARLSRLPDGTLLYCAHEYTLSNLAFALSVEPGNRDLLERAVSIRDCRARSAPTVPSEIETERRTNPFLRTTEKDLKVALGLADADSVSVLAALRLKKDNFG